MVYERFIRSGQWRPCVWAKAVCKENGSTYRVNGKHTSTLLSTLSSEFTDLHVVIETYECETLEDIGRLYGTFDASINSRTASDINRAFSATVPELANLPKKIIDTSASGLALFAAGGVTSSVASLFSPTERAEMLLEHTDFVLWLYEVINDTSGKYQHFLRQGVVAAMRATYLRSKKDATEFWSLVRDEAGEKPTCPDRQLARWLLTTAVRPNSSGQGGHTKKADSREFYAVCVQMWNNWRKGEDVKLIKYYSSAKIPAAS